MDELREYLIDNRICKIVVDGNAKEYIAPLNGWNSLTFAERKTIIKKLPENPLLVEKKEKVKKPNLGREGFYKEKPFVNPFKSYFTKNKEE